MGGSIFFFVEYKTFEFSVEEGGTYYMLHIYIYMKDTRILSGQFSWVKKVLNVY